MFLRRVSMGFLCFNVSLNKIKPLESLGETVKS